MAEGDGVWYNNALEQTLRGNIDLINDPLKLMLVTGHTLDVDTHEDYDDVSADELGVSGYTAQGESLTGPTVTQDNTNDRALFDANNVTFSSLGTASPNYAILVDWASSPGLLLAAWELTTPSNGGDYVIAWSTSPSAVLSLTAA